MNVQEMAEAMYGSDCDSLEPLDPEDYVLRENDGHGEFFFGFQDGSQARVYVVPIDEDGWPTPSTVNQKEGT